MLAITRMGEKYQKTNSQPDHHGAAPTIQMVKTTGPNSHTLRRNRGACGCVQSLAPAGSGPTRGPVPSAFAPGDEEHATRREDSGCVPDPARDELCTATGDSLRAQALWQFEM